MDIENKSTISIIDRKRITISGVKKLESFNDKQFLVITSLGNLTITGKELSIEDMLMTKGDLCINGYIDSLKYTNSDFKKNNESLFKKIFK